MSSLDRVFNEEPRKLVMCKNKLVMKVVDTLLGNEICGQPMRNAHNRVYKKGGLMRLCGKRADYSSYCFNVIGLSPSLHRDRYIALLKYL